MMPPMMMMMIVRLYKALIPKVTSFSTNLTTAVARHRFAYALCGGLQYGFTKSTNEKSYFIDERESKSILQLHTCFGFVLITGCSQQPFI